MTPKVIIIENVSASIVESVQADSIVSTISREDIESSPKGIKPLEKAKIIELIGKYFPEAKNKAVEVFKCESGLISSSHSKVDLMSDGRAFSVGLTQQNLTVTKINDLECPKAFQGRNKYAKVIDEELYQKCVRLAEDTEISLQLAKEKYENRGNFRDWAWCDNKTQI